MDERPLNIPVLIGTVRQGRMSDYAARLVHDELSKRPGVETQLIDIRELGVGSNDEGEAVKVPSFSTALDRADGVVITSPEYNHGYPGMLKHVMDTNSWEYAHKAVGVVSVSSGPWGGTRMIENLLPVLRAYGLIPISRDVNIPNVVNVFSEGGQLLDERFLHRIDGFLSELTWMARTLRYGREHVVNEGKNR